ncbi:fungal-specific transcription factor domain-containing protein [Aspergillus karnatakaensis]|uniref:transcription factor domain-containing protein n=1 Tax=Aspergillus karnatakaensis TaxID=1810916 RepID=UPI003CCD9FE8
MDERAEAQISICSPPTFDALDTSFFNDLNLADLLMPNILESAPFFDFEQQMSSTADPQRAMALPETQPLAVPDQVTEYPPEEASDHGPSTSSATTELGFVVDTSAQQYNAGTNYLTSPSRPHGAPAFPEISPNESEWLLEMYDSEFCILPLTSDTSINPFRCQRQTSQGSRLLYHSILALCCQHLKRMTGSWSTEADDHRSKAAHLLDSALQSKQIQRSFHLLEPMLILFTLDCTLSAAGTWNAHLTRAHSMLQVCGGPSALTTPRVRSQVGMLLWWDTTLALISRRGPVMDQAYLDYLAYWEKKDEWSFFELTGCPRDLLVYLFHLAELARQNEIALSNKWLTFDMTPVLELEQKLLHWKDSDVSPLDETDHGFSDSEVEKQFYEEQDRYHCTEAWRCSLLLYLERVLKRDRRKRYVSIYRLVHAETAFTSGISSWE